MAKPRGHNAGHSKPAAQATKALTLSSTQSISVALIGSGGAGVMTAGKILLDAAAANGYFGLMTRSSGPQIRGGEAVAVLRLSSAPTECHDDRLDLLVALDWGNAERFSDELPLDARSLVIGDPDHGEVPAWIVESGARTAAVPLARLARETVGTRINTIALGMVARMLGLEAPVVEKTVEITLAGKGVKSIAGAVAGLRVGAEAAGDLPGPGLLVAAPDPGPGRWLLSGNQAVGMGALRGGVRFCAAYPITPSTEIQEWLAGYLPALGGCLVQAEDELASINMCLGASFGGVPALTATSGPGLSLMVETLGLAAAVEIPVVVVDVMRCGPSTGIPTKSEQADLNIAIYGLHGDAPHLVIAPNGISDCLTTAQWAVHLAEALQVPSVVLSDQLLGQAYAVIEAPAERDWTARRKTPPEGLENYRRFEETGDGISPMAIPGLAGCQYTATGLTHAPDGRPSSAAADHRIQMDKRKRKLDRFDFGDHWAEIDGDGQIAIITYGSTTAAVREAADRVRAEGLSPKLISIRLLSPLCDKRMDRALGGASRALVVEQSHQAQFYRFLRAHCSLPDRTRSFSRPGPLPLRPGAIAGEIRALAMEEAA